MANTIKRDVELGITNAEGKRGILEIRTGKSFRRGISSISPTVTVQANGVNVEVK